MTECPKCEHSFRGYRCKCGYELKRVFDKPAEPERDVKKAKERIAEWKTQFFGETK